MISVRAKNSPWKMINARPVCAHVACSLITLALGEIVPRIHSAVGDKWDMASLKENQGTVSQDQTETKQPVGFGFGFECWDEPRSLLMSGDSSSTELHPQFLYWIFFLEWGRGKGTKH